MQGPIIHVPDSAWEDLHLLDITSEQSRELSTRYLEQRFRENLSPAKKFETVYTFRLPLSEQEYVGAILRVHTALGNALSVQESEPRLGSEEGGTGSLVVKMSF